MSYMKNKLTKLTAIVLVTLMAIPSVATAKTQTRRQKRNPNNYSQPISRNAAQTAQEKAKEEARRREREATKALFKAVEAGNLEEVRAIVNEGVANVNKTKYLPINDQWNNYTPLVMAAELGHLDIVKFFIEEVNIDVNAGTDPGNDTPLHAAAYEGQKEVVEYLVLHGADVNAESESGRTALSLATSKNHMEIVQYLAAHGASVNKGNNYEQSTLHFAAANGNLDMVKYFVEEKHMDPTLKDNEGDTPLHYAARKGHLEVVKYFIEERNVFPDLPNEDGETALFSAAGAGKLEVARYLVKEVQASVFARNNYGSIPFTNAVYNRQLDVVKFFVEECHINVRNTGAILVVALRNIQGPSALELVKYLVSKGADVNAHEEPCGAPFHGEETALHTAVSAYDQKEVVEYLLSDELKEKADVNAVDADGETPLFRVVSAGSDDLHLPLIDILVRNGADVNAMNADGDTVLHQAVRPVASLAIVRKLVEYGAKVNPGTNNRGETVLHASLDWGTGENEVSRYLRSKGAR